MTTWKFVLCRSNDLANIAELTQARNRQITLTHNRPGSAGFTIPLDDEFGQTIYPLEYAIKAYRRGTTGTRLIWSGYVNTIDEDVSNNRMTVNCVGWLERLNHSLMRQDLTYSDTDDSVIAAQLLQNATILYGRGGAAEFTAGVTSTVAWDGVTIRWPAGSSPNTPVFIKSGYPALPNEGVGGATAYVEARRSIRYSKYQTNIGQAIQQLTDIENGLDIWIDPATRTMNFYRKKRKILPNIVFGFQWGPENIAQYNRQLDGSSIVNYMLVTGGAATIPKYQVDGTSMSLYGPFDEMTSLSDITGLNANQILQYYASAEVAVRAYPREMHSITPFSFTPENSVPEPFVDYDLGDQVAFIARNGSRVRVNQQVRIFGISLSIDEEDNERLGQLQIYPQ
jgi:hypothetical protein